MNHLGRWLSALVDGELDGTERDKVLNHVAGCAACRQEANAMRALKRRLTALGDTCAESPIAGRLIELARSDQGVPAGRPFGGAVSWSATFDPPPSRGVRQIRPGWKIATGSATSALLAIGVIAFLLGNVSGAASSAEGHPVGRQLPDAAQFRRGSGACRVHASRRGRGEQRPARQRRVLVAAGHTGQARSAQARVGAAGRAGRAHRFYRRHCSDRRADRVGSRQSVSGVVSYREPGRIRPCLS